MMYLKSRESGPEKMGTPLNKLKPHRGTTPSLPDSSHVGIHQLIVLVVRIPNSKYIHFNRSDM